MMEGGFAVLVQAVGLEIERSPCNEKGTANEEDSQEVKPWGLGQPLDPLGDLCNSLLKTKQKSERVTKSRQSIAFVCGCIFGVIRKHHL